MLRWEFDDEKDLPGTFEQSPKPRLTRSIFAWIVIISLLIVGGAVGGYIFGRYQRTTNLARIELQGVIDLETWAWQGGNRKLFISLLDPEAHPNWRRSIEQQFETATRDIQTVTIEQFSLRGEYAQVEVRVARPTGIQHEIRLYRLVDGQWRRTEPDTPS